jgi:hypothetical protein
MHETQIKRQEASPMNASKTRRIHRMLAGAAGACLFGLIGFLPMTTEADETNDGLAQGFEVAQDQTRAGAIDATAKILRDEQDKSKWALEVRFENRDREERQIAQFEERIEKSTYRPVMARSGPIPTVAWTVKERVVLEPGAVSVVRHPLPKALCAALARYARAQEQADSGKVAAGPTTSFSTSLIGSADPAPDAVPVVQRVVFAQAKGAKAPPLANAKLGLDRL